MSWVGENVSFTNVVWGIVGDSLLSGWFVLGSGFTGGYSSMGRVVGFGFFQSWWGGEIILVGGW